MEKIFENLYYNPKTGYSSVNELYKNAKKSCKKIKLADVKLWLEKQPTYSLHKPARKHYPRNKVLVSAIDENWQADLVDLQSLSRHNDSFKYLLNCIDVFSKYAWSVPIKAKNAKDVQQAFETILKSSNRKPYKLQTDAGTEFTNKDFQKFLKDQFIEFFTTKSELKASVVERFNRTLKEKMWRFFTKNNVYRYIDILSDLMSNYNHSYHRTIQTFPANVSSKNEREILNKVYRLEKSKRIRFKFKVGDKVRLNKVKRTFEKGFWPNWTEEYFIVKEKLARNPPVYILEDQLNERLDGVFYELELEKIDPKVEDLFIIEKIIKTRKAKNKTDYLVRWRGYPPKFDSWVSDLVKL